MADDRSAQTSCTISSQMRPTDARSQAVSLLRTRSSRQALTRLINVEQVQCHVCPRGVLGQPFEGALQQAAEER